MSVASKVIHSVLGGIAICTSGVGGLPFPVIWVTFKPSRFYSDIWGVWFYVRSCFRTSHVLLVLSHPLLLYICGFSSGGGVLICCSL